MYCVNCGVKLADTEKRCPLCQTVVYHPDIVRKEVEPLYPGEWPSDPQVNSRVAQFILATIYLSTILICLVWDLRLGGGLTWAGYVIGGLLLSYMVILLPLWFEKPNPAVFVPCDFAAAGLYLLYINLATGGGWFLSFAFPITGAIGLIVTTVVVLCRYVRRGRLYVFGGAIVALGVFLPVLELLLSITFRGIPFLGWCWYPMIALVFLGGFLIFLAIYRPARHVIARKFFI